MSDAMQVIEMVNKILFSENFVGALLAPLPTKKSILT